MIDRFGPYHITRELGRGGMGVVYLARDTRLDRDVAIKALPAELATDPARLERFEREARTLAQLNHPNVAGIHGVEEAEGHKYLVLEYVEGATLADLLERGPLSVHDAIEYAVQIAAGVEAAHEAGVIHRDLKPGNIIITPEGRAKVLDFGLARADDGHSSFSSIADAETIRQTSPAQHSPTIEGAILGTAAYMSPEQARGRKVDKRTDIWSFGVVLYEMLIGASPFEGETVSDSIGATLHKNLEFDRLPASTPRTVRHVIQRCLERDKNRRIQCIADARIELEDGARQLDTGEIDTEYPGGPATRSRFWPAIAAVLALGLAGSILWSVRPVPPVPKGPPTVRIASVRQTTDFPGHEMFPSLSVDGRTLLYASNERGNMDIYRLRVGGSNPANLTADHVGDDYDPAMSPDGERIAFVSERDGGGIFIMGATGESPRRISDVGYDPAWSPDGGSIVYTTERVTNPYGRTGYGLLWVVDLTTGERRRLDTSGPDGDMNGNSADAVEPAWSPDGKRIAYWAVNSGRRDIFSIAAEGGDRVALTDDVFSDWNPFWSADSRTIHFISDRGGQPGLWSIAVDERGRPAGKPVSTMPGPSHVHQAAIARDTGQIMAMVARGQSTIERIGFDPENERFSDASEVVYTTSRAISWLDISSDGQWIAMTTAPPEEDIYILRADGSGLRRLTEDLYKNRSPRWVDGGNSLTFYSNRTGNYCIWSVRRDGSNPRIVLELEGQDVVTSQWTSDEQTLAVTILGDQRALALFDRAENGSLARREVTIDNFINPLDWAPDGERLTGLAATSGGSLAVAVCEASSGELTFVRSPETSLFGSSSNGYPTWIDSHRLLGFDHTADRVYVFDAVADEARWIDSPAVSKFFTGAFRTGDTLYILRLTHESELWLIEQSAADAE
jgi:serine/threonine protein kinase